MGEGGKMNYSEITPYIEELAKKSCGNNNIKPEMYGQYDVKRGLRDANGFGVVTGLTEVSNVKSREVDGDGNVIQCPGELFYRGYNIKKLVKGFLKSGHPGCEETIDLLLFSKLPTKSELDEFKSVLSNYRSLPPSFVRDMILKAPGKDMMNMISRSVLALYAYDENPDDISVPNILRQCLQLIAQFPLLSVYGYHSYQHYHNNNSLFIRFPKPEYTTAENLLYILREDGKFTPLEAQLLDICLVLHAEHGGGNNSTFTTHVVTSSGTDTYSAISAALGSLKGPRHGGANVKVVRMFDDLKAKGYLVDALVLVAANMGINMPNFFEVDFKDWIRVIDTNIGWNFMFTRQAAKHMVQLGGGAIVVIGSVNGIRTTKNRSAYCTSKSGLHGLARNLAVELGPLGIRVNTVVAGGIKTVRYYARPEIQNSPHNKNPMGDIAEFEDIANAAYFLADSEQARIITGAELAVDGGSMAQFVYEEEGIKLSDGTVIAD